MYPLYFRDLGLEFLTSDQDIMTLGKTIASREVLLSLKLFSPKVVKIIKNGSRMDIGFPTLPMSHNLKRRVGLAIQQKLHKSF